MTVVICRSVVQVICRSRHLVIRVVCCLCCLLFVRCVVSDDDGGSLFGCLAHSLSGCQSLAVTWDANVSFVVVSIVCCRGVLGGLYPPPHNPCGLQWTPVDSSGPLARPDCSTYQSPSESCRTHRIPEDS
jgi:hypothetical protein